MGGTLLELPFSPPKKKSHSEKKTKIGKIRRILIIQINKNDIIMSSEQYLFIGLLQASHSARISYIQGVRWNSHEVVEFGDNILGLLEAKRLV